MGTQDDCVVPPVVEDKDCEGTWSTCNAQCEKTFKVDKKETGSGTCANRDLGTQKCLTTQDDCVVPPADGSFWDRLPGTDSFTELPMYGQLIAVVSVVVPVYYACRYVYNNCFCSAKEEPIKVQPVVVEPKPVVQKPVAPKPAAPVAPPVKTPEKPVVTPMSYGNMIIIALIVACVIGMLISVYFVCIKNDEDDCDIEDPEAPASGNQRKTSKGSADIAEAQAASKDE